MCCVSFPWFLSRIQVAFYSKAQALVDTLCQRFAADDPSRFVFPVWFLKACICSPCRGVVSRQDPPAFPCQQDVGSMTASADSLLLSTLVELGIVEACPAFLKS